MRDTAKTVQLYQVGTVFVPVTDQEQALKFYVEKLGFEKRADFQYSEGSRWIEVAPPGSVIAIALVPPTEGKSPRSDKTICAIATQDIAPCHATLCARGVEVGGDISRTGKRRLGLTSTEVSIGGDIVPPQFFFRDIDGNRFLVVQT